MKFSLPKDAMIVIADGEHATLYRNIGISSIQIEKIGELLSGVRDNRGAAPLPHETTPHEKGEANFAKDIANNLYERVHQGEIHALVLIADPQTLGQIRPSLHKEVKELITGELHKTLTKSSIVEIERILTAAAA